MIIWTIWVNSWEQAFILTAWDECSRDENSRGWTEAVMDARKSYREVRIIPIECDENKIKECFEIPPIPGEVVEPDH